MNASDLSAPLAVRALAVGYEWSKHTDGGRNPILSWTNWWEVTTPEQLSELAGRQSMVALLTYHLTSEEVLCLLAILSKRHGENSVTRDELYAGLQALFVEEAKRAAQSQVGMIKLGLDWGKIFPTPHFAAFTVASGWWGVETPKQLEQLAKDLHVAAILRDSLPANTVFAVIAALRQTHNGKHVSSTSLLDAVRAIVTEV